MAKVTRTGFITPGVGPSPSEKRRAKESEAAIVAGTTAMQLDAGYAFRSRAKPEWSYETSSKLPPSPLDLEITTFRSGGKGGQHQNKTESGVRVRHLPSGIVVVCRDERSQHFNKKRALAILRERLKKRSEKPRPRIATRVSANQKVRRRERKKKIGMKKQLRRRPVREDA